MRLSLDETNAKYVIRGYDSGIIRINDSEYSRSLIISPQTLVENWPVPNIDELEPEHLQPMLELKPEIVILGTGTQLAFPDNALLANAYRHQIGVEIMDTISACRTFNLLASENRHVVAGLIITV